MKNKTVIISALLVFLGGLLLSNNKTFAQLTGWQYITPITIYENSGANVTNYRALLTFDTQALISQGKMNTDGSDIRFAEDVDGAFLLNYWIESGINTNSTNVWVKAPFIPASDSVTIYLFYGNPGATTTSSVASVFYNGLQALYTFTEGIGDTLYDKLGNYNLPLTGLTWQPGFRNNVYSLTGWTGGGRSFISSNGPVLGTGDFTAFVFINPANPGGSTQGVVGNYFSDANNGWVVKLQGGAGNFMLLTNELGNWCQQSAGTITTAWTHIGAKRNAGVSNYMYQNGNNILTLCPNDTRILDNAGPFEIGRSYNNQYPFDGDISFVAVYNTALSDTEIDSLYKGLYVSPEPTLSIGIESFISSLAITNDTSICITSSVNLNITITDSAGFPAPYTFLWSPATGLSCTTCQNPVANPASTTTYMVIVTDSTGAQDSAEVTITIFSSPPVADAGLDTTICERDSVQLNATGGAYYSWSPVIALSDSNIANPFAYPVITTTYEVTISNGCGSDVDSITITVNPLPVLASADTAICPGDTLQLNASGGVSYLWSPGSGLSDSTIANPVASPSVSINYTLIATTSLGCILVDNVGIIVDSVSQILATTSKDTICPGDSTQLNVLSAFTCDDYSISTVSFAPVAGAGTPIFLSDDQTSSVLPIGFSFNFYCNDYTQFYISSNGFVGFSAGMNQGCCTGQLLPNPSNPNNLIAFAWEDLNPATGGTIDYFTTGSAPNRKLIIEFTNVPHFGGGNNVTSQVILYEGSNAIEIHTTAMPTDGGGHTMGIENFGGTIAHVVPGRNSNGGWSAFNEGIRFSQLSVPDTTFTYIWAPTTGLSNPNIIDPMASPSITTTYIVNAIIGSCSSSDTITIYVDTSNFITANPVTAICEGDSVLLSVTGSAGLPDDSSWTYAWSPGNALTDSTAAAPLAFPTSTTTYQISVSNVCGIYTDTVTVTVNPAPTVDAGVDTSYCFGGNVSLEALGALFFVWSPAAGLSCTSCPKPTASPSFTTTYYVTGTATNGCTDTDSIKVTVSGVPITAISSIDTICPGDATQLDVLAGGTGMQDDFDPDIDSLQWLSFLGGFASGNCGSVSGANALYFNGGGLREAQTIGLNVTTGGAVDFYLIIGTGASPCEDADPGEEVMLDYSIDGGSSWTTMNTYLTTAFPVFTQVSEVIPPGAQTPNTIFRWIQPFHSGTVDNWAIDDVDITTTGGTLDSNATITWLPSTGLSDPSIADPLASPTITTTYVVTVEENGCITTDTITVYVDNTIIALTADVGICTGDSIQLSATSNNPIVSWSWSPTVSLSDDTIANPIANPSSTTTYSVTAIDELGCQFTLDVTVSVAPYPIASFTYSDSALTVMFTDSSVNAGTLLWDFGDGFTSGLQNPTYTYAGPGTYIACLFVTNACTVDTMCASITVTDCQFPLALFGYNVTGLTVDFSDLSINATGWSWDFGDGDTDTVSNPSHTYADTGTYNVCLTATNACGSANICNTISITSAIGVAENYLENGINVYPNPNSGKFTLSMNYEFNTNLRIVVYDVLGRVVWSVGSRDLPRGNNEIEIDMSDHPAGIYNLQVIMDQGINNRKIIIE